MTQFRNKLEMFAVSKSLVLFDKNRKSPGAAVEEKLGVNLEQNCISHGALYVVLSRAPHLSNIVVSRKNLH